MSNRISVEPTQPPVDLETVRKHLRVFGDEENALILDYVHAATKWIENVTWRQLITATYVLRMKSFPSVITVPKSPLIAVSSITYTDLDGASQTVSSSDYTVDAYSTPGKIVLAYNAYWPTNRGHTNDIAVTYTAGYGSAYTSVPADLRSAVLMLTTHLWMNRSATSMEEIHNVPKAVDHLIAPYTIRNNDILEFV